MKNATADINSKQEKDLGNGQREHLASNDEMNCGIAQATIKKANRLNDESIALAIRVNEAREFLELHATTIKKSWFDWLDESSKILESIRQTRVAIGHESKTLLTECGDVRKFFLGADHEKEIARLKEFIELAERLRALKADGTLDKLADTILKLT